MTPEEEKFRAAIRLASMKQADAIADALLDLFGGRLPANDDTEGANSNVRKLMIRPQSEPTELDKKKAERLMKQAGFVQNESKKRKGSK